MLLQSPNCVPSTENYNLHILRVQFVRIKFRFKTSDRLTVAITNHVCIISTYEIGSIYPLTTLVLHLAQTAKLIYFLITHNTHIVFPLFHLLPILILSFQIGFFSLDSYLCNKFMKKSDDIFFHFSI